ncbi:hypothetical protein WMY93_028802 [Mugilogobius chulae]|uniref:BZIP domain-containing protein n=1 Tax=Mugilogobius chulae TaxID=88201 RepID=A0AAW0MW23_9GOBI
MLETGLSFFMQLFWKETRSISPGYNNKLTGDTSLCTVATGPPWEMYQGFPGDPDSGSRGSSSPSLESQYLSSVDSFGSPPTTSASQANFLSCAPSTEHAWLSFTTRRQRMIVVLEISHVSVPAPPSTRSPLTGLGGNTGGVTGRRKKEEKTKKERRLVVVAAAANFGALECVSAGAGLSIVSTGPGSSVGVTAITTSQDLQWMVQPTLISSQASGQSASTATSTMTQPVSLVDPYDLPSTSYSSGSGMTPMGSDTPGPGPMRHSRARSRRTRDVSVSEDGDVGVLLTPEEEEKRRVRRERNKLAAAKCRNRRRELTDRLQSETDILEEEKAELEAEISELQKEKERLEFVLVAHQPNCKLVYQEQPSQSSTQLPAPTLQGPVSIVGLAMKEDSFYLPPAYSTHPASTHSQPAVQQPQVQQAPQPGLMQEREPAGSVPTSGTAVASSRLIP